MHTAVLHEDGVEDGDRFQPDTSFVESSGPGQVQHTSHLQLAQDSDDGIDNRALGLSSSDESSGDEVESATQVIQSPTQDVALDDELQNDEINYDPNYEAMKSLGMDGKTHIESVTSRGEDIVQPLMAMLADNGVDCILTESQKVRINEASSRTNAASKVRFKVTKIALKNEIARRYGFINEKESDVDDDAKTKQPRYSNWKGDKLCQWLKTYPLPLDDRTYAEDTLDGVLCDIERDIERADIEKKRMGADIKAGTKASLRFVHAFYEESVREAWLCVYDSKSRRVLDARNSGRREPDFFELVVDLVNDPDWIPESTRFGEFHHAFGESIILSKDHDDMTKDEIKKFYRDLCSRFKNASGNWKVSGNGQGNLSPEGKEMFSIRFKHVVYAKDDEVEVEIKYVEDDRWNFCGNRLYLGYFWCMSDAHGLVNHATQKAGAVGLDMDRPASSTMGSNDSRKRKAVNELAPMVRAMIHSMDKNASQANLIFLRREQRDANNRIESW